MDNVLHGGVVEDGSTAPAGLITAFSQVYVANGNVSHEFLIDNVRLQTVAAPTGALLLVQ